MLTYFSGIVDQPAVAAKAKPVLSTNSSILFFHIEKGIEYIVDLLL
jgi:hypothetical protein